MRCGHGFELSIVPCPMGCAGVRPKHGEKSYLSEESKRRRAQKAREKYARGIRSTAPTYSAFGRGKTG